MLRFCAGRRLRPCSLQDGTAISPRVEPRPLARDPWALPAWPRPPLTPRLGSCWSLWAPHVPHFPCMCSLHRTVLSPPVNPKCHRRADFGGFLRFCGVWPLLPQRRSVGIVKVLITSQEAYWGAQRSDGRTECHFFRVLIVLPQGRL